MFTGIIEEIGRIKQIQRGPDSAVLTIEGDSVFEEIKPGDSVAVNGICLTVVRLQARLFTVEVMAETLRKTGLAELKPGSRVNLERALRVGDRLGGHLVSGHIDGVGVITRRQQEDIAILTEIQAPPEVMKYVINKGSIAVDGVSLTVVDFAGETFRVSLIPHTAKLTTLGYKKAGDRVNLEADIIGKYVERLMGGQENDGARGSAGGLTLEYLAEKGFL